jgi:hypothetical protein
LKIPQLETCIKYATYFGLGVALDIKFPGTLSDNDIEKISKMLSKYGQQTATLYVVTITDWKDKFKAWCPDISFSFGANSVETLRNQIPWLKNGKTGYNKVYTHYTAPFGDPGPEEFRTLARQYGIELDISLIDSVEKIFNVAFANGMTLIECNNIPMVKRSVREYARNIINPVAHL